MNDFPWTEMIGVTLIAVALSTCAAKRGDNRAHAPVQVERFHGTAPTTQSHVIYHSAPVVQEVVRERVYPIPSRTIFHEPVVVPHPCPRYAAAPSHACGG